MQIRSRIWMIPPALMILVVALQVVVVNRFHLNKWKGGGFAMFSTTDHYSNRFLRVQIPTENGVLPALLPDWKADHLRIICMPNQSLLQEEASHMNSVAWQIMEPPTYGVKNLDPSSTSREQNSILRVYGNNVYESHKLNPPYPTFLVPADQLQGPSSETRSIGNSQVDAYRLVYHGNGIIAGKRISTSASNN